MLAEKLRKITIRTRLIILLISCIVMLLTGGAVGLSSLRELAGNGIGIKTSADKLVASMQERFQRTTVVGNFQSSVAEFFAITDRAHLAMVEKRMAALEKCLRPEHKKDLSAFKKQIEFHLVRRESLEKNLASLVEAQDAIAILSGKLNGVCQDNTCSAAISLSISTMGQIRSEVNNIVNGVSDVSSLKKEQQTVTGNIDKLADKFDEFSARVSAAGKKGLSSLINAFYDLDDAVSSVAAIKTKLVESQNELQALQNKLKEEVLSAHGKISSNTAELADKGLKLAERTTVLMASGIGVGIVLLVVIGFLLIHSITSPLGEFKELIEKISSGNLTGRIEVKGRDELSNIAHEFNHLSQSLKEMIQETMDGVETMVASSAELNGISGRLATGADDSANKANNVAVAAEEMNVNMSSVAAAMEEASINVNTVASGSEEMNSTISGIADNAETARKITDQAVVQGKVVVAKIDALGEAAQEIGKVTETINAISSQTNLLALNATIEAARAGEAGKGFAVVANEIKALAQQTADATGEIAAKIQGIQDSTGNAVSEINEIAQVNSEVNEIVAAIAEAVDQQSSTTRACTCQYL